MAENFDLEQSIKKWRKKLEKHQGLEPGDVEELEAHLRDKIESYLEQDLSEEEAFIKATEKQFENIEEVATEYYRSRSISGQVPPWRRTNVIYALLPNIIKVAFRNLKRNKMYAFINMAGLSLAIACCLVLLGYVAHELSYDRFHEKAERIFRINMTSKQQDQERTSGLITAAVGPSMVEEFPEVEKTVRFSGFQSGYFTSNEQTLHTDNITYADSTLFSVFSFTLSQGSRTDILTKPNSVILSRDLANKLFPRGNALNKIITFNGVDELLVAGIFAPPPANSQLNFSAVISFNSLYGKNVFLDWNGGWNYHTYLLLAPNTDPESLQSKFPPFMDRHINNRLEPYGVSWHPQLQPLLDIHLYSDVTGELNTKGSLSNIYLFSAAGIIILILACINFINLTMVQASGRSREIGIRKVSGSERSGLAFQFMLESITYVLSSLLIAIILILYFRDNISALIGTDIILLVMTNGYFIVSAGLLLIATALISGAYPSVFLSSLTPIKALKEQVTLAGGPTSLIRTLVIFQFAVSVLMITGTMVVFRQLDFIKDKKLGYNKENVMVLPLIGERVQKSYPLLKQQLQNIPGVLNAAGSSDVPGNGFTSNGYIPEGYNSPMIFNVLDIDPDYLQTMDIEIVMGKNFSLEKLSDQDKFLINETLANELGWEHPVGKRINRNGEHEIIGVVRDFNFATLHRPIEPLIFTPVPWDNQFSFISLRMAENNLTQTVEEVRSSWMGLLPTEPFNYYFLDQSFDAFYRREQAIGQLFSYFSIISVFIGCMGLFGLLSYSVKKRTKEIGVRKVLGASAYQIFLLMGKEFSVLILIAFVAATPLTYYLMKQWLNEFAFAVTVGTETFILSGLLIFVIATLTISYKTIKTARANPVESLRSE